MIPKNNFWFNATLCRRPTKVRLLLVAGTVEPGAHSALVSLVNAPQAFSQ
jgi:hypothetical protein